MAGKPFTVKPLYTNSGFASVYYLNGVKLLDDDVIAILNSAPRTADGVPLCRCWLTYCPYCGGCCWYNIDGVENVCGGCEGVYEPTERLSAPKKGA